MITRIGVQALAGGGEVEDDPVPQHGQGKRADIVAGDVEPPLEHDVGLGGQDERLSSAGPAAEADVLADQLRRFVRLGTGGPAQPRRILGHVLTDRHLADQVLE